MSRRILSVSCWLTLIALALMVWSVLDPRPTPVMLAMSVAQGIGTLAFALFAVVVISDLRKAGLIRVWLPKRWSR